MKSYNIDVAKGATRVISNKYGKFEIQSSNSGKTVTLRHSIGKDTGIVKDLSYCSEIEFYPIYKESRRLIDSKRKAESELLFAMNFATFHHRSLCRGYISRDIEQTEPELYSGRFGEGFITRSPNPRSNNFSFINYYIIGEK